RDKVPTIKFEARAAGRALLRALPELAIPVVMIVTLVTGWLQIPEAAAVTALYTVLIEVVYYRDIKLTQLPKIASEAMRLVGAIFVLIVAATALTDYFVNARIPDKLYAWMDVH